MKTIILIAVFAIISMAGLSTSSAQCCSGKTTACAKTVETKAQTGDQKGLTKETLKVSGQCGMCKTRIETTAKSVKGVKNASWNETAQVLTYSFNGNVTKEQVSNALRNVGHDTELGKAPDEIYNALPGCCKYRSQTK